MNVNLSGGRPVSGPGLAGTARALWRHRRASRVELLAFQSRALQRLVAHAYRRVPYYRELFDTHGVRPADVRTAADLERIPVTTRHDLQRLPLQARVARGYRPERLIRSVTSGSSGQPLDIRRAWLEQHLLHLFRIRSNWSHGRRWGDRIVGLGRPSSPVESNPKFVGRWFEMLGMPRAHVIDALFEPRRILDEMRELRPDILAGYPGVMVRISGAAKEADRRAIRPRLVFCGGEVLTPVMRERISKVWRAPVREFYSSHEYSLIAWECRDTGDLHVSEDSTLVEVLADGEPAREGESGEAIATALHSYAMPFIRYALGDVVTRGPSPCRCGAAFAAIRSVEGRVVDYLKLARGRKLHPYQLIRAFKHEGLGWLGEFQIAQRDETRIDLYFVPYTAPPQDALERVRTALRKALGSAVEVNVRMVSEIPRTPGGKLQSVATYGARGTDCAAGSAGAVVRAAGFESS